MQNVFVLVEEWQYDSGDYGQEIFVYNDFENVMERFKSLMKQAKKDLPDYVSDDYCEGDLSWNRYEENEYCYNHYTLTIYIREVK